MYTMEEEFLETLTIVVLCNNEILLHLWRKPIVCKIKEPRAIFIRYDERKQIEVGQNDAAPI